jgi:hypothetical protein
MMMKRWVLLDGHTYVLEYNSFPSDVWVREWGTTHPFKTFFSIIGSFSQPVLIYIYLVFTPFHGFHVDRWILMKRTTTER